jgi:hypothetical protein
MAVPFIGGLNPDYSGLDFCDTAAEKISEVLSKNNLNNSENDQNIDDLQKNIV